MFSGIFPDFAIRYRTQSNPGNMFGLRENIRQCGQVTVQGSRQTGVSSIHRELVMFTVGGIGQASLYVIGR